MEEVEGCVDDNAKAGAADALELELELELEEELLGLLIFRRYCLGIPATSIPFALVIVYVEESVLIFVITARFPALVSIVSPTLNILELLGKRDLPLNFGRGAPVRFCSKNP